MDDKIKILIASVLKPADDVRSYYKIGLSLAQTNKYEVNIIGFDSKKKAKHQNIFLFPVFKFKRNSLKRLFAPFTLLEFYLKLKPQLIIVNTPELLWVKIFIKIIFGTKIIYDIQENYSFNIKQNQIYKGIKGKLALFYLRAAEGLSKHFADGFFLAEEIYEKQLNFIHKKPYIKLLNKSILNIDPKISSINFSHNQAIKIIYSGTIGKEYGTLEAVEFCKNLYKYNSKITLIIIGYSSDIQYIKLLKTAVDGEDYIELKTDDKPVPQDDIIAEIKTSDIAILPYELNPNISGRFPTKIYDYLALATPMIIPPHPSWEAFLNKYQAGICIDFENPNFDKFMKDFVSRTFYKEKPAEEIRWESQEPKLVKFVEEILSK